MRKAARGSQEAEQRITVNNQLEGGNKKIKTRFSQIEIDAASVSIQPTLPLTI
jgi:hypothetical protein